MSQEPKKPIYNLSNQRKRGPVSRFATDDERKKARLESQQNRAKSRIHLGDQYGRWVALKETLQLQSHECVAEFLLDKYVASSLKCMILLLKMLGNLCSFLTVTVISIWPRILKHQQVGVIQYQLLKLKFSSPLNPLKSTVPLFCFLLPL